jgi:hypothetical protein
VKAMMTVSISPRSIIALSSSTSRLPERTAMVASPFHLPSPRLAACPTITSRQVPQTLETVTSY